VFGDDVDDLVRPSEVPMIVIDNKAAAAAFGYGAVLQASLPLRNFLNDFHALAMKKPTYHDPRSTHEHDKLELLFRLIKITDKHRIPSSRVDPGTPPSSFR
jgi:hypothetical protein